MSGAEATTDSAGLRRLATLAVIASYGALGLNLPGLIAGMRVFSPDQIKAALDGLHRDHLIRLGTRKHPDGDRDVVYYKVTEDVELSVI